jgi:hypothetical protein
MSTALQQRILEANSRYANAYNSAGLDIQPSNKLVISKLLISFQVLNFLTNIISFNSYMYGLPPGSRSGIRIQAW